MSLVAPRSFPLIERPVFTHSISNDPERLAAARRFVLIGNARVQLAPPVAQRTRSPNQTNIESSAHIATENTKPLQDTQPKAPEPLSSVARRKLRLANSSVPSYPFGTTPPTQLASASPSLSAKSSNTSLDATNDRDLPELAPVGVVDMRFLTRQPPSGQKAASKAPKSISKSSSAGTPTSPSVPLAAPAPKNQRPKPTAAADGKLASDLIATTNDDEAKNEQGNNEQGNNTKHAFLFRPRNQQPSSGPYIRYSPMYHYYHPYRNLHREAIKTEWARLHPVVERAPPPQEEEVATPPRRTSGRQKKGNGRGAGGKGKSAEKGKKGSAAAAVATTGNENQGTSPPPASGRRSRAAVGKGKGAAALKGQAKGKGGKGLANAGSNKRKRGEFEDDEKAQEGKEDNAPTPPTKRPRRGAAAVAAALAAAQEAAEDAGSAKDEPSPTDAQDETERVIKRRMRPNARKTAAARAAAMVAKQKRKSAEDISVAGTADDNEEEDGGESGKEEDGVTKHEDSQKIESPHDGPADLEPPNEETGAPLPETEPQDGLEQEVEHDQEPIEKKVKSVRGKGGNTRGGRGKNRRGIPAVPKRVYATRGTPRGTPKSILNDDETASVDMGESTRAASVDATALEQETTQLPTKPLKSKRANGNRKGGPHKVQLLYQWGNETNGTDDHEGTPQTEVMDDVQATLTEQTTEATQTQSQDEVATSLNPSEI